MLRRFVLVVFAMMVLISALPAAAQGAIWNSQFYNNPSLSGQPAATRQDAALGFKGCGAGLQLGHGFAEPWYQYAELERPLRQ